MSYEPAYLRYQYSDPEKLRIRAATHRDFTEPRGDSDPFVSALLEHLRLSAGQVLLDLPSGRW